MCRLHIHILINKGYVSSFSMLSLSTQSNGGAENHNTMKTPAQASTHPSVSVSRSVRFQCHSVKGLVQATMTRQNQYSSLTRLTAHSTMWTHAGHWKSILHLSATHSSGCINIVVTNKDNFTGAQFPLVPGWHHVSILHYTVSGHMSHHTGTGLLIMIIQQHTDAVSTTPLLNQRYYIDVVNM